MAVSKNNKRSVASSAAAAVKADQSNKKISPVFLTPPWAVGGRSVPNNTKEDQPTDKEEDQEDQE